MPLQSDSKGAQSMSVIVQPGSRWRSPLVSSSGVFEFVSVKSIGHHGVIAEQATVRSAVCLAGHPVDIEQVRVGGEDSSYFQVCLLVVR